MCHKLMRQPKNFRVDFSFEPHKLTVACLKCSPASEEMEGDVGTRCLHSLGSLCLACLFFFLCPFFSLPLFILPLWIDFI